MHNLFMYFVDYMPYGNDINLFVRLNILSLTVVHVHVHVSHCIHTSCTLSSVVPG